MTNIAIVGPGRLGGCLARNLGRAGCHIAELVASDRPESMRRARLLARTLKARMSTCSNAHLGAEIVWFCVPDSKIAKVASQLVDHDWNGKVALHSSGVLSSEVLAALRRRGARVASVHPLMTFIRGSVPELDGVSFALEGDKQAVQVASRIVKSLGGKPTLIRPDDKPSYHAFATIICPLLVSLWTAGERAASLAHITARDARRRMLPILRQTLANYAKFGPSASFTGPLVRGDVETVSTHLGALASDPTIRRVYEALALAALKDLPTRNRKGLQSLLEGTTRPVHRSQKGRGQASRRSGPQK